MRITELLNEKLNRTGSNQLVIFDIDDTLLHTTAKINVIKDGRIVRSLTNQEFNNYKLQPGEEFDFGEFRNAEKFEKESVPIGPMLDQLRQDLSAGHDVVMLTARADFDNQKAVWRTFKRHGIDINRDVHLYRAGNLPGSDAPAYKKAIHVTSWLKNGNYSKVTMYDDSEKNLSVFKSLEKKFPNVDFEARHVSEQGETKQLEAWSNKYKRSINCNNPKGFSQRAHCQGRKKNEDVKLEELFDPKLAVDLEWAEGSDYIAARGYVTVTDPDGFGGEYGDEQEVELEVEFLDYPHPQRKEYEVQFKVGDSYAITGGGNMKVIFASVIQACKDFVEIYKPDRLFFTAEEQSRARAYDTITKRVAREVGWHVIPFDEIQKDSLYRNKSSNGFVFVIAKGSAPEKWSSAQQPQHGSFMPIWYVYNMDDDQETIALKVRAKRRDDAIRHAMEVEPSFKDVDHMSMWAINTLPKREVTAVKDGGTAEVGGPKQSKKVGENFADGRNPQDKGDSKRHGVPTKASVSTLRKVAKQGGRKGQLAHWMANMKAGREKS